MRLMLRGLTFLAFVGAGVVLLSLGMDFWLVAIILGCVFAAT